MDDLSHALAKDERNQSVLVIWGKGLDFLRGREAKNQACLKIFACACGKYRRLRCRGIVCEKCLEEPKFKEREEISWSARWTAAMFCFLSFFSKIGADTELNREKSYYAFVHYPRLGRIASRIKKFCEDNYLYGMRPQKLERRKSPQIVLLYQKSPHDKSVSENDVINVYSPLR